MRNSPGAGRRRSPCEKTPAKNTPASSPCSMPATNSCTSTRSSTLPARARCNAAASSPRRTRSTPTPLAPIAGLMTASCRSKASSAAATDAGSAATSRERGIDGAAGAEVQHVRLGKIPVDQRGRVERAARRQAIEPGAIRVGRLVVVPRRAHDDGLGAGERFEGPVPRRRADRVPPDAECRRQALVAGARLGPRRAGDEDDRSGHVGRV